MDSTYQPCVFELKHDAYVEIVKGFYNLADGLGVYRKSRFGPIQPVGLLPDTRIYQINLKPKKKTKDMKVMPLIIVDMHNQLSSYIGGTPQLSGEDIAELNLLLSVVFAKKVTDALASFEMSWWDRIIHMCAGAGILGGILLLINVLQGVFGGGQ